MEQSHAKYTLSSLLTLNPTRLVARKRSRRRSYFRADPPTQFDKPGSRHPPRLQKKKGEGNSPATRKPVVADEPGGTCGGGGAGHTRPAGGPPSPSRRAESCASALRAIKYLEVEARVCGWVGGSGPPGPGPGGEKDRCSKAQAQVVRPTNSSEAGQCGCSYGQPPSGGSHPGD